MSQLALLFLGPPKILLDNEAVMINRRKVLALLAYLAVTAQRHNRDELTALLFGRNDREHARANLRKTLTYLRKAIGDEQLGADRFSVWLCDRSTVSTDVTEYQSFLRQADSAAMKNGLSAAADQLNKAVELYRGEFLSGFFLKDSFSFEEWQLMMQESFQSRQASALKRLSEIHETWGHYEQAIDYCRRWLWLDPLAEVVHRRLMELYTVVGRHTEAIRQYEKCRSVLERELGQQPDENTEQLYRQIKDGKLLQKTDRPRESLIDPLKQQQARLFLFVQIAGKEAKRARQQEIRIRESIVKEQGRILTGAHRPLCASFSLPDAAVRKALEAQDCGLQVVLLGNEHNQQDVPTADLMERGEMFLEILHERQILLDEKAAELVSRTNLPDGVSLRNVGAHRLKDLGPPLQLHLLDHDDLIPGSDRLETLDMLPHNLQIQPTPFIGRKVILREVQTALAQTEVRLLTLVGTGGTGKTRLALQAAAGLYAHFDEGIYFVDLAALSDSSYVLNTIAVAVNVWESGSDTRSPFEQLKDFLANKRLLLLLDNFEHLLPAGPQVAKLLASCPQLKILVTSREALHLQAERVHIVRPMRLPAREQRVEAVKRCETVRLFAERAVAVQPAFELSENGAKVVAEICNRLDGLPLAIELAATRIRTLTPQTLLTKLNSRLEMLKGGSRDLPQRQRALRSEIDWSYELLNQTEGLVFMRLSVFSAGSTMDAAEAVCLFKGETVDVFSCLSSLAEKSLISVVQSNDELRFRMLGTIREYAWERLEKSGELDRAQSYFASYYLKFVEDAELRLYGPDQVAWLNRIEQEYGNIRATLTWLHEHQKFQDGLLLSGALGWFWFRKARFSEGQHWLQLFSSSGGDMASKKSRAKTAYSLGCLKLYVSRAWGVPEGRHYFQESLDLYHQAGDLRGVALSQAWLAWKGDGEDEESWAMVETSVQIARKSGDPWTRAWCLIMGYSKLTREDKNLEVKKRALGEAISLSRRTGDPYLLSFAYFGMGLIYGFIGEFESAEPWHLKSLSIARDIDDSALVFENTLCLADGSLKCGKPSTAKRLFKEGLTFAANIGALAYAGWFFGGLYHLALGEGLSIRALRLGAISESILNPDAIYDAAFGQALGLAQEVAAVEWELGQSMNLQEAVAYALEEA